MTRPFRLRWVAVLAGTLFLLAHLPWLAWFLDDIDAINFAMGLRDFDVARHQPHPPGSPLFILLGHVGRWFVPLLPGASRPGAVLDAGALAVWGAIGGAVSAVSLLALFTQIEGSRRRALGAMLLTLVCPLFWFTSGRPLSDMPGFALALVSQALAATAFARQRGWATRQRDKGQGAIVASEIAATGRLIVLSALVAGLAVGMRSQTCWLTLPLLALVIVDRVGRAAAGALLGASLTFGIGVVLWFLPMLVATGGPARYLHALTSQAGEDFGGVDMLVTSATPVRRLVLNLFQTFAAPWVSVPLAAVVLAAAAIGLLAMLRGSRRGVTLLAGTCALYALFHLAFQENETVRYGLPLVPAVAYFAVRGLDAVLRRAMPLAVAALVAASLFIGVPALAAYAGGTSPVFQLFADMRRAAEGGTAQPPAVVGMHERLLTGSRRAREWAGPAFPWRLLPAPAGHEWRELVTFWREGGEGGTPGEGPVWFIADPHRTDLALIDPVSRQFVRRYRWPFRDVPADPLSRALNRPFPAMFDDPALIGGARPDQMDWYVISPPGWFLADGWSLTPETSGVADRDRQGPGDNQAVGYVRRRPEAVQMMIGGRNLGAASDPVARIDVALDGRPLETFDVPPAPGFFLRGVTLPAGTLAGAGPFAELTVRASAAAPPPSASTPPPRVRAAVEQFDLQSLDEVMVAYDAGWHEAEFDPGRGLSWRWSSDAATLRVWSAGHDVALRLRAESPHRYFPTPPTVVLRAGTQTLATQTPNNDFEMTVRVPAAALQASGGVLTLATDRVFVPADVERRSQDRRRLGLRVYDVTVTRADAR